MNPAGSAPDKAWLKTSSGLEHIPNYVLISHKFNLLGMIIIHLDTREVVGGVREGSWG